MIFSMMNLEPDMAIIVAFIYLFGILVATSVHEFAHAKVAFSLGDYTPKAYGRLTLNPLAHISPIGFLMFILFGFGYARPVPINPSKFKYFRLGYFLTSSAGIITNLIVAFFLYGINILFATLLLTSQFGIIVQSIISYTASINVALAIFNILPIAPLDGFKMLHSLCNFKGKIFSYIQKYSFFIMIAILIINYFTGFISICMFSVISSFNSFWYLLLL